MASEKRRKFGNVKMIAEFLLHGAENALSTSDLIRIAGLKSSRELQIQVAKERDSGILILSTCRNGGGYFLPDEGEKGQAEIDEFVRTLVARALNTLKALQSARKALEVYTGQCGIEEVR